VFQNASSSLFPFDFGFFLDLVTLSAGPPNWGRFVRTTCPGLLLDSGSQTSDFAIIGSVDFRATPCVNTTVTVQHGSADTVVRAMNVKYRKWRLGGSCNSETP